MSQLTRNLPILLLILFVSFSFLLFPGVAVEAYASPKRGVKRKQLYERVYVLSIGVNKYNEDAQIFNDLDWAEVDAIELSELFAQKYGYQTKLLTGLDATKQKIIGELEAYAKILSHSDVLIITFSGHGQTVTDGYNREGFIVPAGARISKNDAGNLNVWQNQAISMNYITEYVESLNIQHLLMFIDVCYSGFLGKRGGLAGHFDLQMLLKGESRKVVTAGREKEPSWEKNALKHGLFSYSLLEALKTDELKSTYDLFISIREKTAELSSGQMLPQLRNITMKNDGEFVFIPMVIDEISEKDLNQTVRRVNDERSAGTSIKDLFMVIEEPDPAFSLKTSDRTFKDVWADHFQRFHNNAVAGNSRAMAALYFCYKKGLGTEKDATQAKAWAMEAFETGDDSGLLALADYHRSGLDSSPNPLSAEKLIKKAADQGFIPARFSIARSAVSADKSRYDEYEDWIREAYEAGSKDAGVTFAVKGSLMRMDNEKDIQDGEKLLTELAQAGHSRAMYLLAKLYSLDRKGFPRQNQTTAWLWLNKSAEHGDEWAQAEVASAYCQIPDWKQPSYGQRKNPQKCLEWAELAVKQGNSMANEILYNHYLTGVGGRPDLNKARDFLETATKSNEPWALNAAGLAYKNGTLYPQNIEEAKHNLNRAIELGFSMAAANLFEIYYQEINWQSFFHNKGMFTSGKDVTAFDISFQLAGKSIHNGFGQAYFSEMIKKNGILFQRYLLQRSEYNWSTRPEMLLVLASCKESFSSYMGTYGHQYMKTDWNTFFSKYANQLAREGYDSLSTALRRVVN